ncbi:MAG: metallophosphoesterase [Candidatus Aminicenantes bacterium]|nr:metallophosphoesterase [Candidatus Aminicenantes bacterium]
MAAHFDIIGDIHGHAGKLRKLLLKLGYSEQQGCFRHPGRQTIFVGDLIDRGTANFAALAIVKPMVDNEQALIVVGNHEYNALCYHTRNDKEQYLRRHSEKNLRQHQQVLDEIAVRGEKGIEEWQMYLDWFSRLPLLIEVAGIRVVHACWDRDAVEWIKNNKIRDSSGRLTKDFLVLSVKEGTAEFEAVETLLKGKEIYLPEDHPGIVDKDGCLRRKVRVKWWLPKEQRENAETYDQVTRINENSLQKLKKVKIPDHILEDIKKENAEKPDDKTPVFFGHYWFTGKPRLLSGHTACVDYSVARGGQLVCYRYDGESLLDESKFVFL